MCEIGKYCNKLMGVPSMLASLAQQLWLLLRQYSMQNRALAHSLANLSRVPLIVSESTISWTFPIIIYFVLETYQVFGADSSIRMSRVSSILPVSRQDIATSSGPRPMGICRRMRWSLWNLDCVQLCLEIVIFWPDTWKGTFCIKSHCV